MAILNFLLLSIMINLTFFVLSYFYPTKKFTDASYAFSFFALLYLALYLTPLEANFALYLLTAMITIWAGRLNLFLFIQIKHAKKEPKFNQFRQSFTRSCTFWLRQGLTVWLILLPSLFYLNQTDYQLFWPGFIIWLIGINLASFADWQKFQFKKNKDQTLPFVHQGLWRYSRHPNYFGEMLCWLGLYLYTLPSLSPIQQLIALISPLTVFSLLFFFNHLPLLEKKSLQQWGNLPAYQHYLANTSLLIPLPPKNKFLQFYHQCKNHLKNKFNRLND